MPDIKTTANSDTPAPISRDENARNAWSEDMPQGPDAYTRQVQIARLNKSYKPAATGNLADLDRLGGLAVGESVSNAFLLPLGYEKSDVTTPAKRDAALGIYNTETARTGLVPEPPAPVSGDGSIAAVTRDPGSQSPEVIMPGKSGVK